MTLTHEQLEAADRQAENLHERRLAELTRDEVQCVCGQWTPKDHLVACDVCGQTYCGACLREAMNPLTDERMEHVCEVCRANIQMINKALLLWSNRRYIAQGLQDAGNDLRRTRGLALPEWGGPVGSALGTIDTMQTMYNLMVEDS